MLNTLLLDQGYQPIQIIPWQRAICMVILGKAEMVATHDTSIRTVSEAYPTPAVVRLYKRHRNTYPVLKFSKDGVHARDGYLCQYCGTRLGRRELTLDHVVPRHAGGPTSWDNLVTSCSPCNLQKGGRTPSEAGMTLRTVPGRPRLTLVNRTIRRLEVVPAPWQDWIR